MTRIEHTVTREEYDAGKRVRVARTAVTPRPKAFPAKYQGICAWCGKPFPAGERIKTYRPKQYMHHWCWAECDKAPSAPGIIRAALPKIPKSQREAAHWNRRLKSEGLAARPVGTTRKAR